MENLMPVGKVSKLFGLAGEVTVNLYDTFPVDMNKEEPLYVRIDGLAVPLFLDELRRRGRSGALIRFADVDTPERAEELIGLEIFMRGEVRSQRSGRIEDEYDDDELFLEDLVGYHAVIIEAAGDSSAGNNYVASTPRIVEGEITGYIDDDMNPLFRVVSDGKEILIPAADEFMESADTASKQVEFVIPEGLLDLYV